MGTVKSSLEFNFAEDNSYRSQKHVNDEKKLSKQSLVPTESFTAQTNLLTQLNAAWAVKANELINCFIDKSFVSVVLITRNSTKRTEYEQINN